MPTNPPANPLPGAVYLDQTTNLSWVWTGTFWLQATGGSQNYLSQSTPTTTIVPGYYSEPSPDSWFPHIGATAPSYPSCGQIWIDDSVTPNYASVWDCNTSTWIQLGGIPGGDTNSIVSTSQPPTRLSGDAFQSGDFWINPNNNSVSYYNGASWIPISTPDTNSVNSTATPFTRNNGDALKAGDLWTNPSDASINFWDGSGWVPVVAVDPDHQLATSDPVLRPDGQPLQQADLYTNTVSNTLFYYNGGWKRYNDSHSFELTGTPLTRPDGTALQGGDQWYNPTTDQLYVRDSVSSTWILVSTNDTHSWWSGIALVNRPDSIGSSLQAGDIWVNNVADPLGYHYAKVWDGGGWAKFGAADTHAIIGAVDPTDPTIGVPGTGTLRKDGKDAIEGDIYINTVTGKAFYLNTASIWTAFGTDTHSFIQAGDPTATGFVARLDGTPLQNGDIYIDTTTNQGHYYKTSDSSWNLFGSDTHSIIGVGDPNGSVLQRLDGSPLQDGDQYIDTTSKQGWYYDTASTTWALFGDDTHSFTDPGIPALMNRPNGSPLQVGDQHLDTTTMVLRAWDGVGWEVISQDSHSILGTADPNTIVGLTRADGSPVEDGDMFVDTTTKQGWYYESTAVPTWTLFGSDTHSFTGAGTPYIALPGTLPQSTRPNGSALKDGDQFLDTNTKILYSFSGADWVQISVDTHSIVGGGTPYIATPFVGSATTTARPDGSDLVTGDIFIDNITNEGYFFDGAEWIPFGTDTHSIAKAGVPGPTGTNTTTRTDNTALKTGDLYTDLNTFRLYVWDGAAWQSTSGGNNSIQVGTSEPTLRDDNSDLEDGDQWLNTNFTPPIEYTRITGVWVPNADVTVFAGFPATNFPNQLFVNSLNNRMYRYDSTAAAWVQVV